MAVEYYNLGGALSQEHWKACLVSQCSLGSLWCWPLQMRRWKKAVRFKWSKSFWVLRSRQAFLCRNQSFLNCQPTELVDLLGPESWILFHQTTAEGRVRNADIRLQHSIYKHSKLWQKILFFMTILSEIFVLFKIFLQMYKSEDMKQNVM